MPADCPTGAFDADHVATWGLEELAFTTELVVSELVTTAIRYSKSPIQLRMILQSALTCEVSDAGRGTAPHLRRARVFDEGGRGQGHLGGAGDSSFPCRTLIRSGVRFLREMRRAASCPMPGPTCHSPPNRIALRS